MNIKTSFLMIAHLHNLDEAVMDLIQEQMCVTSVLLILILNWKKKDDGDVFMFIRLHGHPNLVL